MPQETTAAQIMRTKLVTLTPSMTVMDATELLLRHSISGAPVLDQNGSLVGILSELDCVSDILNSSMNNSPIELVESVMTRDVVTVAPDTNLTTLAHMFSSKRFRRLPVVDEQGRLLGQLSRRDLMKALYDIMIVSEKRSSSPLFFSAVYDSDEIPAKFVTG